jgi:hypothetical protein
MHTLTGRTALQVNALVALVCLAGAAAIMSLVLTQPETVAAAMAQHEYGSVAAAVAREVAGWLRALLHFL